MIHLAIIKGGKQGTYPLPVGKAVLLGRGSSCDIQIDDPAVSRVHCQLEYDGDTVKLVDTNSSWGTLVNGKKMTECDLQAGDKITIGETVLLIEDEDADTLRTMPPKREFAGAAAEEFAKPAARAQAATPEKSSAPAGQFIPADWPGQTIMHFEVQEQLAVSRTGVLFLAWDTKKNRNVALKLFRPEYLQKESDRQRFIRAVKTMLSLRHPHLVTIYAAGIQKRLCFIVSEYIEAASAAQMIERIGVSGMLDWQNVLRIGHQIGQALEFAAEHKIVHRNITPNNILVRESDKVAKLGDIIFAKALEGTNSEQITRQGELVGELAYLPPEQLDNEQPVDCRCDIYSLGASLYALLTGHPPFEGRNTAQTINKILNEEFVSPKKIHLSIPDMFEGVIIRMLAKSPVDRFQTPTQLVKDLERTAKYQGMVL